MLFGLVRARSLKVAVTMRKSNGRTCFQKFRRPRLIHALVYVYTNAYTSERQPQKVFRSQIPDALQIPAKSSACRPLLNLITFGLTRALTAQ